MLIASLVIVCAGLTFDHCLLCSRVRRIERLTQDQIALNRLDDKWKRYAYELFLRLANRAPKGHDAKS